MKARVFTNGDFWVTGRDVRRRDSLAALDGRIIRIGDYDECLDAFPRGMKPDVIDLEGKTVLPGFTDSHIHLLSFGLTLQDIPLADVNSIEAVKARIRARAAEMPEGRWISAVDGIRRFLLKSDILPARTLTRRPEAGQYS